MGPSVSDSELLSFAGLGLKLNESEDVDALVLAVNENSDITTLNISGNTLGIPAAEALGNSLSRLNKLQSCIFSDLFTGRMKTEIAPALRHLSNGIVASGAHLVELDLSDNAFGPNGVVGVVDLLSSPACFTLQILRMNNQGLGHEGCRYLTEAIRKGREASGKRGLRLKVFSGGRNRLENVGAEMLSDVFSDMGSLEELALYQNGIGIHGVSGVHSLVKILKGNPNLRILNFSDNNITPVGGKALARALKSLNHLEEIYLSDCILRSQGTRSFAAVLADPETVPDLRVLNLTGNEITRMAAISLIISLGTKSKLELLDLNTNEFGQTGIRAIIDTLDSIGLLHVLPKSERDAQEEELDDSNPWESAFDDDQGSASEEEEEDFEEASATDEEDAAVNPVRSYRDDDDESGEDQDYQNGYVEDESECRVTSNKTNGFSFRGLTASLNRDTCVASTAQSKSGGPFGGGGLFSNLDKDSTDAAVMRSKLWTVTDSAQNHPNSRQPTGGLFFPSLLAKATSTTDVKAVESVLRDCLSSGSGDSHVHRLIDLLNATSNLEVIFPSSHFQSLVHAAAPEDVVRISLRLSRDLSIPPQASSLTYCAVSLLGAVLSQSSSTTGDQVCRVTQAVNCLLVHLGAIKAERGSEDYFHLASLDAAAKQRCRLQYLHVLKQVSQSHASQLAPEALSCLTLLLSEQKSKETESEPKECNSLRDDLIQTLEAQLNAMRI